MNKLDAKALRDLDEAIATPTIPRHPVFFILDNIYDTYNIGGLFRLADGLAIEKLYICGDSETPPNHRIKKASIGTYKVVPWEYCKNTIDAINLLRTQYSNIQVAAIEQHARSRPYYTHTYSAPLALIVGNETTGVSAEVLYQCDSILEIPMYGINISLNVIVSAAIVGYHAYNQLDILSTHQV
ncbi:MAG: 23S rRNA (guanosine-2'-O-)-methyltransferase RlmB [Microgenomates bacterium OLB23]|nr:MAG: 23S rRNA (guanosine-2'-O-)-methyltransferase RlmB [Microgenomates bacterium OLB23]